MVECLHGVAIARGDGAEQPVVPDGAEAHRRRAEL